MFRPDINLTTTQKKANKVQGANGEKILFFKLIIQNSVNVNTEKTWMFVRGAF